MADITFVIAPIGGGKSLFATGELCKELRKTERSIVTNLPLVLTPEECDEHHECVCDWAHREVSKPVFVPSRIRRLTNAMEVQQFWRYLPNLDLPELKERVDGGSDWADLRASRPGCLYIIDEVHLYFRSREWQKVGPEVEFYMSQLRKMNDDLILVTQHPEKVDKNFRRNATEWLYFKNLGKAKLWGGVSLKGRFKWNKFESQPMRTDKPVESGFISLTDKGYHKLYRTMAGVGITGRLQCEEERKPGRGVYVWVVALVALLGVALFVPYALGKGSKLGVALLVGGKPGAGVTSMVGRNTNVNVTPPVTGAPSPVQVSVEKALANRPVLPVSVTNDVCITGIVMMPGKSPHVALSDGTILTATTRERVVQITGDYVVTSLRVLDRHAPMPVPSYGPGPAGRNQWN